MSPSPRPAARAAPRAASRARGRRRARARGGRAPAGRRRRPTTGRACARARAASRPPRSARRAAARGRAPRQTRTSAAARRSARPSVRSRSGESAPSASRVGGSHSSPELAASSRAGSGARARAPRRAVTSWPQTARSSDCATVGHPQHPHPAQPSQRRAEQRVVGEAAHELGVVVVDGEDEAHQLEAGLRLRRDPHRPVRELRGGGGLRQERVEAAAGEAPRRVGGEAGGEGERVGAARSDVELERHRSLRTSA